MDTAISLYTIIVSDKICDDGIAYPLTSDVTRANAIKLGKRLSEVYMWVNVMHSDTFKSVWSNINMTVFFKK